MQLQRTYSMSSAQCNLAYNKMMQGQEITEEDNQQAQEVVVRIQQDAKITKLMETEQRLNVVIGDVNKIIMKPLEELYSAQQQA